MAEPFPEKPKGMRHDTYMRLFWEHHEAEWEHLAGMREWPGQATEAGELREFVRQFGKRERPNDS